MEGQQKPPPGRPLRPRSKTPAERAEEFTATQRRLKDEATARRDAAAKNTKKKG